MQSGTSTASPSRPRGEDVPAIETEHVQVTYGDGTEAIRDVSLRVECGEFFGFLGPNGAGKTTTIRTLVTLLYPTEGTVRVNGFDVRTEPQAVRESIGYMAQETSVDEELTARENLRFACEAYGVSKSDRADRIDDLLEIVDLADVADERPATFSGGMKKRLDAATALVHRPPLVFLDEPTTGLDPAARRRLWEYFERLNDAGTTVFLTTQYLEEADRLCDRLAVIDDGRIVASDTPDALKSRVGGDVLALELADSSARGLERATRVVHETDAVDDGSLETTEAGLRITSERARRVAHDLVIAFHEADVRVTGFDVRSPTLDDVFLSITGDAPDCSDDSDHSRPAERTTDSRLEDGREVVR
ncbi:ABC transporter ATP-binding protein [Natrialba sp. INN-245]|uniref:ABC transporter ATP-binding protein n=1 Tax=Natrialba sp. INN-245 TaxID=2690967 RepID=UPI0013121B46|nr:ABC transporter ATP-binding protein [Natrialba sp. INN-245]MWV40529.1 ATP-binding cassette domain-containing protein [Natrialba sp. INN-245]